MNHSGIISTSQGQHGIQNVCVGMCVWQRGLPEFWAGSTPCLPRSSPIFLCPPSGPRRISPRKLNLLSPPTVAPVSVHHSHHRHLPCSGWPKAPINFSPSLFSNQQSSQVWGTSRWAPGKTVLCVFSFTFFFFFLHIITAGVTLFSLQCFHHCSVFSYAAPLFIIPFAVSLHPSLISLTVYLWWWMVNPWQWSRPHIHQKLCNSIVNYTRFLPLFVSPRPPLLESPHDPELCLVADFPTSRQWVAEKLKSVLYDSMFRPLQIWKLAA